MENKKTMDELYAEDRELYHADRIQRARMSVKRLSEALLDIQNDDDLEIFAQRRLESIAKGRVSSVIAQMSEIE